MSDPPPTGILTSDRERVRPEPAARAETRFTRAAGKAARATNSRATLARLVQPGARDPVGVLAAQHRSRLTDLVPVHVGRMAQSPFAFYRGSAAIMAADLGAGPHTGLTLIACGDAHISNFGFFASPERSLLFDLNDFDEAGTAPWEWDVKRLATSVHVGGRDIGMTEQACAEATMRAAHAYAATLRELTELDTIGRYYFTVDSRSVSEMLRSETTRKAVRKARTRTSDRLLRQLVCRADQGTRGTGLRIVDQPPIARHVDHATPDEMDAVFQSYRNTLREDTAYLLEGFRVVDYVLRIVGVGSVGTRCYVIALEGPGGEVLFLQAKEAQASVLTSHGRMPHTVPGAAAAAAYSEGHRVVACQRILQAHSDPFLGHIVGWAGEQDERPRVDYYWRQFRDMKGSIDPAVLTGPEFAAYAELCGRLLARAHAQSPTATAISGYIGNGDRVAGAIAQWAAGYADVCEADYAALQNAIRLGALPAEFGV